MVITLLTTSELISKFSAKHNLGISWDAAQPAQEHIDCQWDFGPSKSSKNMAPSGNQTVC